jgi:hypothetical protein
VGHIAHNLTLCVRVKIKGQLVDHLHVFLCSYSKYPAEAADLLVPELEPTSSD